MSDVLLCVVRCIINVNKFEWSGYTILPPKVTKNLAINIRFVVIKG